MSSPVVPFGDNVVAVRPKMATKTASGLYLPDKAQEKSATAEVVAVGNDVKNVKVGDKVVFKEYAPTELKIEQVTYLVVKEDDVLAKIA